LRAGEDVHHLDYILKSSPDLSRLFVLNQPWLHILQKELVEKANAKVFNKPSLVLDAHSTLVKEEAKLNEFNVGLLHFVGKDLTDLFKEV